MSGQLPPIDQDLRAQLARRSGGRLPEGLADQVFQAVDAAPVKPRYAWRAFSPRSRRSAPRTLLAGASLAAVLLLAAALVVVPRFQVTPAASGLVGYPADRALTTAELAALMAGPALPTNTALVADVVIDIRTDVCPMDRYGTVGIVEGMASQVCVMTASDVLIQPVTIRGIMAFRYLAPGILGLLGEITPASSATVAFRVADDWPLGGKTFLVEGWLTQLRFPVTDVAFCTGGTPVPAGDPLDPNGSDPCVGSWLTESPNSLPTRAPEGLEIPKAARLVEAAGIGDFDAIPSGVAVRGVYIVRSTTEGCPGDPPQSSRGCGAWRVLAQVAEISMPAPSGTPLEVATAAPTTAPPATPLATTLTGVMGTGNQPLTTDELETLMVTRPDHLAGRVVIVEAPIPTQISCQSDASGGGCAVNSKPLASDGAWAVSIGADGTLSLTGQIATPTAGGYVFKLDQLQVWSSGTGLVIVDAWLDWETRCDTLPTAQPDRVCHFSLLFPDKPKWMHMTPDSTAQYVKPDNAYLLYGSQDSYREAIHGLYLMRVEAGSTLTMLARLETETASAAPVTTTPATPMATPVASLGGSEVAPTALFGEGDRPLTVAEFPALWAADPAHLAGRIAIVKGPVPTGFECSSVGQTGSNTTSPRPCYADVVDGQVAPEGYWAIRVGSDGMLSVVGKLSTPGSTFVVSLEEARAVWKAPGSDKAFVLVDAWIGGMGADACDVVGQPCYEASWLAPGPYEVSRVGSSPADGQVNVQPGAYHMFGAGSVGGGPAIQGVFLVQGLADEGQVVARMEVAVP